MFTSQTHIEFIGGENWNLKNEWKYFRNDRVPMKKERISYNTLQTQYQILFHAY